MKVLKVRGIEEAWKVKDNNSYFILFNRHKPDYDEEVVYQGNYDQCREFIDKI